MCMAVLSIKMICKLRLNPFNLGPFGGAHGIDCRSQIRKVIEYGVLSHTRNL